MKRSFFCLLFLGLLSWQRIAQEKAASEPPNSASSEPAYGEKLRIPGIHNAGKINDLLYRGGQPKQAGLAELKKLGITTIVDLRRDDPQKRSEERRVGKECRSRW